MLDLLTLELAISGPSKPTADTPEGGDFAIMDGGTNVFAEVFHRISEGRTHDAEAIARRMVACWNSNKGVPTELLEQVQGLGTATMPYRVMRKQHAELLAALQGLHHVCQIALAGKGGRQYANLETRAGSFIHMVPVMQAAEDAMAAASVVGAEAEAA